MGGGGEGTECARLCCTATRFSFAWSCLSVAPTPNRPCPLLGTARGTGTAGAVTGTPCRDVRAPLRPPRRCCHPITQLPPPPPGRARLRQWRRRRRARPPPPVAAADCPAPPLPPPPTRCHPARGRALSPPPRTGVAAAVRPPPRVDVGRGSAGRNTVAAAARVARACPPALPPPSPAPAHAPWRRPARTAGVWRHGGPPTATASPSASPTLRSRSRGRRPGRVRRRRWPPGPATALSPVHLPPTPPRPKSPLTPLRRRRAGGSPAPPPVRTGPSRP